MSRHREHQTAELHREITAEYARLTRYRDHIRRYPLQPGDKARFKGEKRHAWTVQVAGPRYMILTRQAPFRRKGLTFYTICDRKHEKRGPTNNLGNGWDMESAGPYIGARALHVQLLAGAVEVSNRHSLPWTPADLEVKL